MVLNKLTVDLMEMTQLNSTPKKAKQWCLTIRVVQTHLLNCCTRNFSVPCSHLISWEPLLYLINIFSKIFKSKRINKVLNVHAYYTFKCFLTTNYGWNSHPIRKFIMQWENGAMKCKKKCLLVPSVSLWVMAQDLTVIGAEQKQVKYAAFCLRQQTVSSCWQCWWDILFF